MALKIRLRQQGRTNRPFYRIVVADCRSPRDGKYLECLGWYNPFETELDKMLSVKADRIQHWISVGAQFTDKTESLVVKVAPTIVKEIVTREAKKSASKRIARRKTAAAK
jgi:small subunit ribosomal protein S16